ncbi:MAG: 50S ribosomal protein L10 [Candidatus Nomurabacteria bacterium]|jgi:large subunit ribosomal protein L10|nr:50S ribosomal protein L10 [Candidatus Nomurabacteria bacterium]
MAISRDKKTELVAELKNSLTTAKMTVFAAYDGMSVKDLQALRRAASAEGVKISVAKNRLVKVALQDVAAYKDSNPELSGQLLYAFSDTDEVLPASVLEKFAKTGATLKMRGGISGEGKVLAESEVVALAALPSKNVLIGQVVSQLLSGVNDTVNALSGNLHNLLDGLEAKATN